MQSIALFVDLCVERSSLLGSSGAVCEHETTVGRPKKAVGERASRLIVSLVSCESVWGN